MAGFGGHNSFGSNPSGGFGTGPAGGFGTGFGAPASTSVFGAPSLGSLGAPGGFGTSTGGFGAPAPAAMGGFGSGSSTPTSGGFGVAPSGFGASAPAPTVGFGSGFGTNTTPVSGAFGSTPSGFGAPAPVAFGTPGGGFGTPAPATGGFGSSGFGTPAPATVGFGVTGGFGASAPATGGFGTPSGFGAPAPGGFGIAAPMSGGFDSSSTSGGFGVAALASGGFGAASATGGFGVAAPVSGGFGVSSTSGGFGAAAPVSGGFGASSTPGGFGVSAPVSGGFGASSSGFGTTTSFGAPQVQTSFGAPAQTTVFGALPLSTPSVFNNAALPTAFGTSTTTSSFGHVGLNNSTFGAAASNSSGFTSSSGFVTSGSVATSFGAPVQTPFSQSSFPVHQTTIQSSTPFGTSTNAFGTSAVSAFGSGNSYQSQPMTPGNPFAGTAGAPISAMTFGSSASVIQTNEVSMQDGSNDFDGGNFGAHSGNASSGFGQPFAASSLLNPSAPAFAPQGFTAGLTFGPSPFGKQTTQDDDMGDARTSHSPVLGASHSPVPEASMLSPTPYNASDDDNEKVAARKEAELARLKAKLADKRKKLEEAKLRKSASENSPPPSPKQLRTSGKLSSISDRSDSPEPAAPVGRSSSPKLAAPGSLAARNALRFGPKVNVTRSQLPDDLDTTAVSTQNECDVVDLQNAKSLVGTCQYMCPDDELKRRENEGDIQLLETVHPAIHPAGWTLRNTAVKRFRRSAADYKLDIPELVRPPDVLERVCAYLEEWVMERDRQGIDPRFSTGAPPTPLEVYQFIWDRTRMVRKDFILQNYVGTGGKCDARAVRCHERIARWHAMCEHQLSHIPDFVRMQSQQNIAEMGQAIKTLNLFYDDLLGRSTVDVADEDGRETRTDSTTHGGESNIVMGVTPVDFDGKTLRNDEKTVASRIIGSSSPARGTAEPEMRAIYILLTLENDGGMEVLKYAAKLSSERQDVFNSKPVQLALEIFKVRRTSIWDI